MNCQPKWQKCKKMCFVIFWLNNNAPLDKNTIFCWLFSPGSAEADTGHDRKLNGHLMASCVRNIPVKIIKIW